VTGARQYVRRRRCICDWCQIVRPTPSLYLWLVPDSTSVIHSVNLVGGSGTTKFKTKPHTPQECQQSELEMCRRTRTALLVSGLGSSSGSGANHRPSRWAMGPLQGPPVEFAVWRVGRDAISSGRHEKQPLGARWSKRKC